MTRLRGTLKTQLNWTCLGVGTENLEQLQLAPILLAHLYQPDLCFMCETKKK